MNSTFESVLRKRELEPVPLNQVPSLGESDLLGVITAPCSYLMHVSEIQ